MKKKIIFAARLRPKSGPESTTALKMFAHKTSDKSIPITTSVLAVKKKSYLIKGSVSPPIGLSTTT